MKNLNTLNNPDRKIELRSLSTDCNGLPNNTDTTGICLPGVYSIENGILKFTDFDEFVKTLDFLSCADDIEMETWRNTVPITTAYSVYIEFMDHFCQDSLSQQQIDSLINLYEGQIKYSYDSEGNLDVDPLYISYAQFRNMDGYFLIGQMIQAEEQDAMISIFDGDWGKLTSILNTSGFPADTVSYAGDTAFVISQLIKDDPDCCPNVNKGELLYPPSDHRRLKVKYEWYDLSIPKKKGYYLPQVYVRMHVESDKNTGILGWRCHKKHWTFNLKVDWYVVPTRQQEHELRDYDVMGDVKACKVKGDLETFHSDVIGPYPTRPKWIACVWNMEFTSNIYATLPGSIEQSLKISCSKPAPPPPPPPCTICPAGYYYDNANCYSHICKPNNPFVWHRGYYYQPGPNNSCPYGGSFDGANCLVGYMPVGWKIGEGFVYNGCYYVRPHCP